MKAIVTLLLCLVFAVCHAGPPYNTVFVYNDDGNDAGFGEKKISANQIAKGYIWQQLGLLDGNGKPGTVDANGDIRNDSGDKLGSVIKDLNGNPIGVQNADGTKAAFDINSTNVTPEGGIYDAFDKVADDGTFVVMKHGGGKNGTEGGAMHGDGGKTYDGVVPQGSGGTGTNRGSVNNGTRSPTGPMVLRGRPGANIKVILFVCNGGKDPDQSGNRLHSVGDTFRQIPGVGPANVSDFPHTVAGKISWHFFKGNLQQQQVARGLLLAWAVAKGFVPAGRSPVDQDVADAIARIPQSEQFAAVNAVIAGTGACVGITYSTDPQIGAGPPDRFTYTCPLTIEPGTALTYTFEGPPPGTSAWLHFDATDVDGPDMYHIEKISPPATPFGRWGSGVFDFRELNVIRPTPGFLTYELEFYGNPSRIRPVRYDFGAETLMPIPVYTIAGDHVSFELRGAQMVGAVELVDNVLVEGMTTTKGRIVSSTVWDPTVGSAMDLTLANTGISASFELNTSEATIDMQALGIGPMIDIRGFVSTSATLPGSLQFQLLNRTTGVYDTVYAGATTQTESGFNIMGTNMTNYFDGSRRFKLRIRSKINGPLIVPEFQTRFGMLEVVSY